MHLARPTVVKSQVKLVNLLRSWPAPLRLIAIDGISGAGKSSLRTHLSEKLGATGIEFDDFLDLQLGEYLAALRTPELKTAIARSHGLVVCSGVCMLQALQQMNLIPDVLVYVKRMARWGWADQDEVEGHQIEDLSAIPEVDAKSVRLLIEIRSYHRAFMPQATAEIIFERLEQD